MTTEVRNLNDQSPQVRRSIHGGDGELEMWFPYAPTEFVTALRTFELCRLPPGASIADHMHSDTEEIYHIVTGEGTMLLDGEEQPISVGDVILTQPPSHHSIRNTGSVPMDVLIVEVDIRPDDAST